MNLMHYWIIGNVAWLIYFTAGETYALITKQMTLSQFVWHLNGTWPLLVGINGLIVGGLMAHFFGSAIKLGWKFDMPPMVLFFACFMIGGLLTFYLWRSGG